MSDFREALKHFGDAVRQEGERSEIPDLRQVVLRQPTARGLRLRWVAAVAAMLIVTVVPALEHARQSQLEQEKLQQEKADAVLLEQVNAGLSRSVARAMAPLANWAPGN